MTRRLRIKPTFSHVLTSKSSIFPKKYQEFLSPKHLKSPSSADSQEAQPAVPLDRAGNAAALRPHHLQTATTSLPKASSNLRESRDGCNVLWLLLRSMSKSIDRCYFEPCMHRFGDYEYYMVITQKAFKAFTNHPPSLQVRKCRSLWKSGTQKDQAFYSIIMFPIKKWPCLRVCSWSNTLNIILLATYI